MVKTVNWTDEQKRIIDLRDSNILVSAAAGSGKTAVLVERIITLVRDQEENLDSFLVVTFTNEAASGMKRKIHKALVKAASEDKDKRHLRNQLSLLGKAQITTFHSFCLDVLRKNFSHVGLDPGFRIGDMEELDRIYREAMDQALEAAYKEGEDSFRSLVEGFSGNRYDGEIQELVDRTYRFIQSFPQPFHWLDEKVGSLCLEDNQLEDSPWYWEVRGHIRMNLEGAQKIAQYGLKLCNQPDGPDLYEKDLQVDLEIITGLLEDTDKGLAVLSSSLKSVQFPRISAFKAKDNPHVDLDKKDHVKDVVRKKYKDMIKSLEGLLPYSLESEYTGPLNEMHKSMRALQQLVSETDRIYGQRKKELSLLDYNDLEKYALEILLSSQIALEYKKGFKYIFIDEYQDINGKQEAIIDQIKGRDNLFMVGDVKQSIYRFRLADPSIFNHKYENFDKDGPHLDQDKIHRVIELNRNFRSRREILDSTNHIFSKMMTAELGEVDYDENVYLNTGRDDFADQRPVELNVLEMDSSSYQFEEGEEDESLEELEFLEKAEAEAIFCAGRIKNLLKEDSGISYKDVVILMRAVTRWSSVFEEVFRKEGIPFYFDGGGGYYNSMEIQLAVNILKLVDNLDQDIPLLSVMRSPVGNFTTEEMIRIRTLNKKGPYFEACRKLMDMEGLEDGFDRDLSLKLKGFNKMLLAWVEKSRYMTLDDLIWNLLLETGFYEFAGSLREGKQRQANLRMLVDKAADFAWGTSRSLYDFLKYIQGIMDKKQDGTSSAKTLGANDDVVRLMSIHSSKGLEFPVVILCALDKGFNKTDTSKPVLLHKDLGIGPRYFDLEKRFEDDTMARMAIGKKNELEGLSEEMRILYVAMTRAIDRLIMVGTVNGIQKKCDIWTMGSHSYFLYKGKSYLDWLGSCLFEGLDGEEITKLLDGGQIGDFALRRVPLAGLLASRTEKKVETFEDLFASLEGYRDESIYKEVHRRLSFRYPYVDSGMAPAKLAVTALKSATLGNTGSRRDIPPLSGRVSYGEYQGNLTRPVAFTGGEIGSLVHSIMEHMDLDREVSLDAIRRQVLQLAEKKVISRAQEEYLVQNYLEKIHSFYRSSIGRRMIGSPRVKREVPFILKKKAKEVFPGISGDDEILIQGIIDCYFEEDGEIVILDYKTDSLRGRTTGQIGEEYRGQIQTYREAIERITGKKVKASYLYLFSAEVEVKI